MSAKSGQYAKFDDQLKRVSKNLGTGSLRRIGGSLYLRATFPPKKGELVPKQRDLPLGLKAIESNLSIALERALKISSDLVLDRFVWEVSQPITQIEQSAFTDPVTIADFVDQQRAGYFSRRKETKDTEQNWLKDYGYVFNRLPHDAPLSIALLRDAILQTDPNSRTRIRAITAYSQIAALANLDTKALRELKGTYTGAPLNARTLPKLETVIEWHDRLSESVRYEYAIRAAYGLRPGEGVGQCKFDNMAEHRELMIHSTKTTRNGGWRVAYPFPESLFDTFRLGDREPLEWISRANSHKSRSDKFARKLADEGLPFTLYDLRHLYAWHTIVAGVDVRLAAQFMGHSLQVHDKKYNAWIGAAEYRQLRDNKRDDDSVKASR